MSHADEFGYHPLANVVLRELFQAQECNRPGYHPRGVGWLSLHSARGPKGVSLRIPTPKAPKKILAEWEPKP